MPRISWSRFVDSYPTGHLIAGIVPEEHVMAASPRELINVMSKLLSRLRLRGSYALTVDRQNMTPEIHCVFERELEVALVAQALEAHVASRYPGWVSQRTFRLDAEARRAI